MSAFPSSDLRVYAVWFSMVASDSKRGWPGEIVTDRRVLHFWDEGRVLGAWYGERTGYTRDGGVLWDAFFVYGPEAKWGDPPGPLVASGRPVIVKREELMDAVRKALGGSAGGARGRTP